MRLLLTADPEIEVPPRLYGGIERIVDVLVRRLQAGGPSGRPGRARPGSTCPADAFYPWPGQRSQSKADTLLEQLALVEGQARFPARPRAQLLAHRLSAAASARTACRW